VGNHRALDEHLNFFQHVSRLAQNVWSNRDMEIYREELRPSAWMYFAAMFMIPTTILVCAPMSIWLGIVLAAVIYSGIALAMYFSAPAIVLTPTHLQVGKARIERRFIAASSAFSGSYAVAARGVDLDARAWMMFRGWINPVVRVDLNDPSDPTPYWIFSTRRPEELVRVLRDAPAAA
jgi:hypothetical protein